MLQDYHTHSHYSTDSEVSVPELVSAAQKAGVTHLAVTDHCDLEDWGDPSWREYRGADILADIRALPPVPGLDIAFGIELGQPGRDFALADRVVSALPYDIVLCSLHTLRTGEDLWRIDYPDEAFCLRLLDDYMTEWEEMTAWDGYHVLAHLTFPLRYMAKAGFFPTFAPYEERMRVLFARLARRGLGLELNVSGLRYGSFTMPDETILRWFKESGGEIVTVGSDAHSAGAVGGYVREGQEMLKNCGFAYAAVYRGGKPAFLPL